MLVTSDQVGKFSADMGFAGNAMSGMNMNTVFGMPGLGMGMGGMGGMGSMGGMGGMGGIGMGGMSGMGGMGMGGTGGMGMGAMGGMGMGMGFPIGCMT